MSERSSGRGRPDDWDRGDYVADEQYYASAGQQYYGAGMGDPGQAGPDAYPPLMAAGRRSAQRAADSKGFFEALFDFSFTSFVTVKIIRVLYVLILVMTTLSALGYTILAFTANSLFGLVTLVILDPLFIIIVMAFWRLVLEAFVVVFRIAEDVRSLRERADR